MRPSFTVDNNANVPSSYVVFGSERFHGDTTESVSTAYFYDFFIGKLGRVERFPPEPWLTSFFRAITHIVGICTNKQMVGVAAWGIVALVTNKHPLRYRPMRDFVTNTVSEAIFLRWVIYSYVTVAVLVAIRSPHPTLIGQTFVNFLPEAIIKRFARINSLFLPMADYVTSLPTREFWFGEWCIAATRAQLLVVFVSGIMELHQNLPFWCQALGHSQCRQGTFVSCLLLYCNTFAYIFQVSIMTEPAHKAFI